MATSGELKSAYKKLKNLFFVPKTEVKKFREKIEETFSSPILPNRVESTEREYAGVVCDVLTPEVYASKRILLYVHGGCFAGGSKKAYRPFAASLANAISARAVIPEFRLAPTYPFPASIDDVQNVFKSLYTEEFAAGSLDGDASSAAPEIIIAADGSGASIALAVVFSLLERYKTAVKKIILFSPWLDLSPDNSHISARKHSDGLLTSEIYRRAAELYTYQENRNLPVVSAVKAGKLQLEKIPPVLIQTGSEDLLLDDIVDFKLLLEENKCLCDLDVWQDMPPMFQMADEELKEAHLAVDKIGKMFTHRSVSPEDSAPELIIELEKSSKGVEE